MTISYYIHAWQGLLMFLAGIISVLAAFGGYLQSGGGEEVLRRALVKLKTGNVNFDTPKFDWLGGKIIVTNLRRDDYQYGEGEAITRFSGLHADSVTVKLDIYPWPPEVKGITVYGMRNTAITVSDGFLQNGKLPRPEPGSRPPPIEFVDCNLNMKIGDLRPLDLTGCSGELRFGVGNELRGAFSLRQLNNRPFNFQLETLEDGRWVFAGNDIVISTKETLVSSGKPLITKVDPLGLLVRALFTGDLGAEGTVTSLRVVVQPETKDRKFVCDGEVAYKNLEFNLPSPSLEAAQAVPFLLDKLLGAGENFWPRWMQVDRIKTGERGRVNFHMAGKQLDFSCDEGIGSGFTGIKNNQNFPPLESLKGSVETDDNNHPKRILLRGFLGNELSFETRVDRSPDGSRTYELLLTPRAGDASKIAFGKPLWRFASRVQDYLHADSSPPPDENGQRPLVVFELESDARHFPWPEWLPPGMRDISGHMYAKGRFTDGLKLRLESVTLDDHATITYGGLDGRRAEDEKSDFGPLWQSLQALFGTNTPWKLQDITLQGRADVQFGADINKVWKSTDLFDFKLTSGTLSHAGLNSEVGLAGLSVSAHHEKKEDHSLIDIKAKVAELWEVNFAGTWNKDGDSATGNFTLKEKDVPYKLHPLREQLDAQYISKDMRRINRTTKVKIVGKKAERTVEP